MRLKNGVEVSTVSILTVNPEESKCVWVTLKKKSLSNIVLKTTWDLKTSQDVSSQINK